MAFNQGGPQYNNNPRAYTGNNTTGQKKSFNAYPATYNQNQTDGVMMVNEKMGKFLRTRFWNRCMGIDIGTYAPGTPLDFNAVKNAQVFGHMFSFSTIFELREICDEVIESIKQTNTFESTATEAGQKKDAIVEISNGKNINLPNGIYLVIYKGVDPGKRTNQFEAYPFASSSVMRNYDHNTGNFVLDTKSINELKKFRMILDQAAKAFTMAQAHSIRDADKNDRLSSLNMLAALSTAMGVDINASIAAARMNGRATHQRADAPRGTTGAPNQFHRQSQGGQWNRGGAYTSGQYGNRNQNPPKSNYQNQQAAMASLTDEPVDINLDAATLQQVDMSKFM